MKKLILVSLILIIVFPSLYSQKNFGIGVKSLIISSKNDFTQEGNLIEKAMKDRRVVWVPYLEARVINNLYMEVGFMFVEYIVGYYSNLQLNTGYDIQSEYVFNTYQMPVNLKYKLKIGTKFLISPNIGIVFAKNNMYIDQNGISEGIFSTKKIEINIMLNQGLSKYFQLFNLGFDLEYVRKYNSLGLNIGYAKGSKKLVETDSQYHFINSDIKGSYSLSHLGSYLAVGLMFKYNFNL